MIVFRCDGGSGVGAGHVARSLQIASAFAAGGTEVLFVGGYDGIAASLLDAAGLPTAPPEPERPLGAPAAAEAVVVDSYTIEAGQMEAAAAELPVAAIVDEDPVPGVTAVLSYHLDAAERIRVPDGSAALLGPELAPVRPSLAAARRPRGFEHALVTAGGGETGLRFAAEAAAELLELDARLSVVVAAPGEPRLEHPRVAWRMEPGGLSPRIAWADVAVSAAGSTPYDLACAGVPAALRAVAPNQEPVAAAFLAEGLAVADAGALADSATRERLAAAGVRRIDGYGAYRARDALAAAFAGRPAPRRLTYRPAVQADAELLLAWRNEPEVRAVSRTQDEVPLAAHEAWLGGVLADPDRTLLVVEHDGRPVGTLRFDRDGAAAEISVTVSPQARGGGLGAQAIAEGTDLELAARPELERVEAVVLERNLRSLKAFRRAGFEPERETSGGSSDDLQGQDNPHHRRHRLVRHALRRAAPARSRAAGDPDLQP